MNRPTADRSTNHDLGLGVVELIVYIALSALALTIVLSVFITGTQANEGTRERDAATGAAQIVFNSIQPSIRNASTLRVNAAGTRIDARVAVGSEMSEGWECQAWVLTPDHQVVHTTSSATIGVVESYNDWAELAASVRAQAGEQAFRATDNRLEVRLTFREGTTAVPLNMTVAAQAKEGTPGEC